MRHCQPNPSPPSPVPHPTGHMAVTGPPHCLCLGHSFILPALCCLLPHKQSFDENHFATSKVWRRERLMGYKGQGVTAAPTGDVCKKVISWASCWRALGQACR